MLQEKTLSCKDILTCPECGKEMRYKESRERTYMKLGGKKRRIYVDRYFCEHCRKSRTLLPQNLMPNKLYERSTIEKVVSGKITEKSYISLYGPTPITIRRWLTAFKDTEPSQSPSLF